jgi:hypothetical protein
LTDEHHLSPELIAAYLAAQTSTDERELVQEHMLRCERCRHDVAEAAEFGTEQKPRRWIRIAIPAAAAALLLFALVPGPGPTLDGPAFRGPDIEGVQHFAAVLPLDGAAVNIDSVEFVWESEGPEVHYVLTLTDENGDVVWKETTRDTVLAPPREAGLRSDRAYFWYVDALLEGAESSTTGVREFSLRP